MKTLRIITLFTILTAALSASAQSIIFGTVQDGFLKTPLPDTKVSLLAADSTVITDSIPIRRIKREDGTVKEAQFMIQMEKKTCKYWLRASLDGYDDGWLPLSIDGSNQGAFFLDDPIEMRRMRTIEMNDVVVTATKVKMYYRGDTIVYDATAFQLLDGSMLDDLIRQMPGVTMNEHGEIFVNNRKIDELQLGSRSFMGGNSKVLLENLPYYTVKDIKVYDQDTDLNRALGKEVEEKKFVMDVNLKKEFQMGYIANIEAAGGTQERWLGRGFLLGFTDRMRYTLLGNANNVNEGRHIGSTNHWTPASMPRSLQTTYSAAGEIDYQRADKNLSETLNFDYTSSRDESEMHRRSELAISGSPLFVVSRNALSKENKLQLSNRFKYIKPGGYQFETSANFNRKTYSGNSLSLTEQFIDSLTTRQRSEGISDGTSWGGHFDASYKPRLKELKEMGQYLSVSGSLDYSSNESQRAHRYATENFVAPSTTQQHNASDYANSHLSAKIQLYYSIGKGLNSLSVNVAPVYSRRKSHDWLYHPDTLLLPSQTDMLAAITDRSNSYDSREDTFNTGITLQFTRQQTLRATEIVKYASKADLLNIYLTVRPMHEHICYRRGALDTIATRSSFLFEPGLDLRLYVRKDRHRPFRLNIAHRTSNSSMLDRLGFRDDATPLVVRLSNPNLKPLSNTTLRSELKDIRSARHNWTASVTARYHFREIAQTVVVNPTTGVYTYRPENVNGAYEVGGRFTNFQTFDADRLWTFENTVSGSYQHFLDHSMLAGETESREHAIDITCASDNMYVQYSKGALNVRVAGSVNWRHSEGRMRDFSTLNAFDYQYGMSARYTIPVIKTTVSADATMYSRRGYGSASLNTDDFVINASLSQPVLKGKLIARIEAFDLLHNLSSTQYEVNAQGRTVTWYRSLLHYIMAHIVYHWNKNPKKK